MIRTFGARLLSNKNTGKVNAIQKCYTVATGTKATTKKELSAVNWEDAKPYESMPGPTPLPLIGNAWRFLGGLDILKIFKSMHDKYGDVVRMQKFFPDGDAVIIYDVRDIEWLFRNEGPWPRRIDFKSSYIYRHIMRKDIFGDTYGTLNGNNEDWGTFRSAVNPIMMQPRVTNQYIPQINDIADEFIQHVHRIKAASSNGEMPANFMTELDKWAFESITVIALDTRLGVLAEHSSPSAEKGIQHVFDMFDLMFKLDIRPTGRLHIKFNTALYQKYVRNQDFFTNWVHGLIADAQNKINNDPNYKNKPEQDKSVFEKLVAIDKKVAMVMTLDMLGAGLDTTSKVTSGCLYNIAKHTEVQEKLRAELKRLLPNKNSPITKEVLDDAKYLRAVIKESLRLIPIASGNVRVITKPIVFGGYQVPAGTIILVPHLYLSKGTDKHFDNPGQFTPERWLREKKSERANAFVTQPFGFGARSCLGKRMASMEIEVLVAKMVRNFCLEWNYPDMKYKQALLYGVALPLKFKITEVPN